MASVTFAVPDKTKEEMKSLKWVNWSELTREETLKKENLLKLLERLESEEEKELTKWSVELGRKAKKGRFKKLLSEVPPEIKEKLLNILSPKERKKIGL